MQLQRRRLLQLSSALPLALPVSGTLAATMADPGKGISLVGVTDQVGAPLFNEGDVILADSTVRRYRGEGVYLYPDWGRPRAYLVRQSGPDTLTFYNPGRHHEVWTMRLKSNAEIFSGRAFGILAATEKHGNETSYFQYSDLTVPKLQNSHEHR